MFIFLMAELKPEEISPQLCQPPFDVQRAFNGVFHFSPRGEGAHILLICGLHQ